MKKVYLVFVDITYKDFTVCHVLLNVFASAKKMLDYVDYKNLLIQCDGADKTFGSGAGNICSASIRMQCESICTVDWSDELKKLKDETL